MNKIFKFNVISMRKYILIAVRVKAETEAQARAKLYTYLCNNNLINNNLFYKLELLETLKAE